MRKNNYPKRNIFAKLYMDYLGRRALHPGWNNYPIVILNDLLLLIPLFYYPQYTILIIIAMATAFIFVTTYNYALGKDHLDQYIVRYDPNAIMK